MSHQGRLSYGSSFLQVALLYNFWGAHIPAELPHIDIQTVNHEESAPRVAEGEDELTAP